MERDKNYDLELAGYIWSILKSNLPVLMSWGVEIETVKAIKCGLEFRVNGFKHTGKVQIVLNEGADLFEVCLIFVIIMSYCKGGDCLWKIISQSGRFPVC